MRYLPTLFRGRDYAALPGGEPSGPARGEAGADSDQWLSDLAGGGPDVNPELTGTAKFLVYDEMAKTDPTIKGLIMFFALPVRSAAWGLNPASDDPVDVAIRDCVAWNLGLEGELGTMDMSWDELTAQLLGGILRFGPMFEELVWDDPREWRDKDGDPHLIRPLAKLGPRYPSTVQRVNRKNGRIASIEQMLPGTRPIPIEKLSYTVFEREGGRWDGVSPLRPAWGAWTLKKALMISAGLGWDRYALGLPVVWHPDTPDGEERAKSIGRNIRAHERGYVHFPSEGRLPGGEPDSEWLLELLNGASTLADPTPLLRWLCEQEYEAGMLHFASLGKTQSGSRAVAETQIDPFFLAVQTLANYVARERARQLIRPFVRVNFGDEAAEYRMPRLTVSKVQAHSIDVISKAIALLEPLGFRLTEPEDQNDMREMLGFGKLPDAAPLAQKGVDRARLSELMTAAGVDAATLAKVVNQLPADVGVARNRDGRARAEGNGLPVPG